MKRHYHHCPACGKRLKRFTENVDEGQAFYVCHAGCGKRLTLLYDSNAFADDWPREVFDEAVRAGLITEQGQPIPS